MNYTHTQISDQLKETYRSDCGNIINADVSMQGTRWLCESIKKMRITHCGLHNHQMSTILQQTALTNTIIKPLIRDNFSVTSYSLKLFHLGPKTSNEVQETSAHECMIRPKSLTAQLRRDLEESSVWHQLERQGHYECGEGERTCSCHHKHIPMWGMIAAFKTMSLQSMM